MDVDSEYTESAATTFEWTLRGLRNLFESTKGDAKAKVTKSVKFGGGRWQILFYANAGSPKDGTADGGFISLYLSCEPTTEEKEAALADGGRWVREGTYKFSFELRNLEKNVLYNLKEAPNHTFSQKTANWGWAQFARRDAIYYQSSIVKTDDAFIIVCKITSSPAAPPPPPAMPRQSVPKSLLDTVGALLDDKAYSDVEFVIPRRGQPMENARRIWASRRMLKRAEYFDTMFNSGFSESLTASNLQMSPRSEASYFPEFEDSDDEGDDDLNAPQATITQSIRSSSSESLLASALESTDDEESTRVESDAGKDHSNLSTTAVPPEDLMDSTPGTVAHRLQRMASTRDNSLIPTPQHVTVVVRDVAYTTYYAILYYLYTDNIVFAPLSSSFFSRNTGTPSTSSILLPSDAQGNPSMKRTSNQEVFASRAEWIKDWKRNNPGRPAPCSAKAAYRVADKLDLRDLKERAAQHINKSLTVDNIAYEVFSPFAAAFEEIRKEQIEFFLSHWAHIRASDSMKNVWQQIRNGRHPGFEEVWPVIASSLEFKQPLRMSSGTPAP